jgi:hypothetical protein
VHAVLSARYVRRPEIVVIRRHTACNEVPAGRYKQGTTSELGKGKLRIGPYSVPLAVLYLLTMLSSLFMLFPYEHLLKSKGKGRIYRKKAYVFSGELNKNKTLHKHFCN